MGLFKAVWAVVFELRTILLGWFWVDPNYKGKDVGLPLQCESGGGGGERGDPHDHSHRPPVVSQPMDLSSKPLILVFNYRTIWYICLTGGSRNEICCLGNENFRFWGVTRVINNKIYSYWRNIPIILCCQGVLILGQFCLSLQYHTACSHHLPSKCLKTRTQTFYCLSGSSLGNYCITCCLFCSSPYHLLPLWKINKFIGPSSLSTNPILSEKMIVVKLIPKWLNNSCKCPHRKWLHCVCNDLCLH